MDAIEVCYRKLKIRDDVYYTLQINGVLHSVRLISKNNSVNMVSEERALIGYVLKQLEVSGDGSRAVDGKAVGSIKLVYSEKLLINTDLSSQYNIVV